MQAQHRSLLLAGWARRGSSTWSGLGRWKSVLVAKSALAWLCLCHCGHPTQAHPAGPT